MADAERTAWRRRSTVRVVPPARARKLAKVPFVELADGRLQGVVSSGSDVDRVYVSSIASGTHAYHCSTNNNRPCGGLRGAPCKHLHALADEALLQYGAERVARYLRIDVGTGADSARELLAALAGRHEPTPAAVVFSRFLRHLSYLELPGSTVPLPELHWFPATGGGPLMLGTQLTVLRDDTPTGLADALDLVTGLDDALVRGLARVGADDAAALAALAGALAATPLGDRLAEAVAKVTAGSVAEEHLLALAGARCALLGAAHDALLGQLDAALGRTRAPWAPGPVEAVGDGSPARAGARAWLHELAVTGWAGLDHELVAAAGAPVEAALAEPHLRRLAVLLDGLAAELRACVPVATMAQPPVRRWADLWARGVLLAQDAAAVAVPTAVEEVSGRLLVLGVDVHEHDTAVQAQLHAILEPADGGPPRLVRSAVGAVKVETIVGPALWRLLDAHPVLLAALAERRSVTVTGLPLRGADLIWHDERVRPGEPADPFATARVLLPAAVATASAPLERHPVGIAEPVLVEGYTVRDDDGTTTFALDGQAIDVAVDRLPSCGPLTPGLVAASSACLGLLRWDDGRWLLQPLAVRATVKRQPVDVHTGDWAGGVTDPKIAKAEAKAGDAVAVLRERAGRLLRR